MKDRTGEVFGYWKILSFSHKEGNVYYWLCVCKCGKKKVVRYTNLHAGHSKSCGCSISEFKNGHGLRKDRLYNIYRSMIARCYNPKATGFKHWGGRGIRVCEEWKNDNNIFFTWALANGYKVDMQLDRINNNGNYGPDNCRFVDRKTNCRNRSSNMFLEYKGEAKILIEWCEHLGLSYRLMISRLREGWSVEKAFETPARKQKQSNNHSL